MAIMAAAVPIHSDVPSDWSSRKAAMDAAERPTPKLRAPNTETNHRDECIRSAFPCESRSAVRSATASMVAWARWLLDQECLRDICKGTTPWTLTTQGPLAPQSSAPQTRRVGRCALS